MNDNVNHPQHYTLGKFETIDVIQDTLSLEEFRGFCIGNVLKYTIRHQRKGNAKQDLQKAKWYLNKLIDTYQEG